MIKRRLTALKGINSIVLFLAVCLVPACASVDYETRVQNAGAHFKIGLAYLNDNKVQQAYVEFHKANELDPKNKEVLNAIGIIYLLNFDETQKAITYFQKAVDVDHDYSEAYNNLGYAYEKMGSYDTAISFYKKALANPMYATAEKAYINIGNANYRLGKFDVALQSFKEAIKRAPANSLPYLRLALCYNAMGRYGEASTAMTQAIALDPEYNGDKAKAAEDLTLRGLRATGNDEKDIKDYIEILKY
ncbi:MAG: tetratricopeptide repeat protein [Nitrospirae bacterium]|nr:tetratricopeptide repeat protein [Nitrospirota bacterium]